MICQNINRIWNLAQNAKIWKFGHRSPKNHVQQSNTLPTSHQPTFYNKYLLRYDEMCAKSAFRHNVSSLENMHAYIYIYIYICKTCIYFISGKCAYTSYIENMHIYQELENVHIFRISKICTYYQICENVHIFPTSKICIYIISGKCTYISYLENMHIFHIWKMRIYIISGTCPYIYISYLENVHIFHTLKICISFISRKYAYISYRKIPIISSPPPRK